MKHAHILLLLPCGMLPPLAGAQRTEPPGRFDTACAFQFQRGGHFFPDRLGGPELVEH